MGLVAFLFTYKKHKKGEMYMSKRKKTLWFRMGIALELTEEEFKILRKGSAEPYCAECCAQAEQLLISKMRSGEFLLNGDTYSPTRFDWDEESEWPHDTEISFELLDERMDRPPCPEIQVKVIMDNGCVQNVLKSHDAPVTVELIHADKAYPDYEDLIAYRRELELDPSFKDCNFTVARFESDDRSAEHNTKIRYLYRDAHNYKVHNECIIRGVLSDDQQRQIREALLDGQDFIPSLVGLPEVKFEDYDEEADGPWFELDEDSFEITEQPHTVDTTAEQLTAMFAFYKGKWHQHI
jgi:hypothetical protein